MVNAVMDAIALLSSLASDLDVMLNDLRSAPSHASANQQQLHQQPQQQQQQLQSRQLLQPLHHWQSINNNNVPHPLKAIRSTTISTQNCLQNNRRRVAPKPLPRPPRRSRPANANAAREAVAVDDAAEDTDASDLANMTSPLSASAAATRIMGLSPEVKKVQRLPLWCHPHTQTPTLVQLRPQRRPSQRHHHHHGLGPSVFLVLPGLKNFASEDTD
ncbi:protein sprint-like [Drosophila obscura]|uniref:protein sprint-like n=1 Tax=Drosophila obscura TaxID=7282 RepID=UPI001BB2481A|nr:protein sprint-like [Drosophila obscura]